MRERYEIERLNLEPNRRENIDVVKAVWGLGLGERMRAVLLSEEREREVKRRD